MIGLDQGSYLAGIELNLVLSCVRYISAVPIHIFLCLTSKVCHGGGWRDSGESQRRDSYRNWHHRIVRLSLFFLISKVIHTLSDNSQADGISIIQADGSEYFFFGASQNICVLMGFGISAAPLRLVLRADGFLILPNGKAERDGWLARSMRQHDP